MVQTSRELVCTSQVLLGNNFINSRVYTWKDFERNEQVKLDTAIWNDECAYLILLSFELMQIPSWT